MLNNHAALADCPIFHGLPENEIEPVLKCLKAGERKYSARSMIFHAGSTPEGVYILLKGRVQIIKEDFLGNRSILMNIEQGGLFAESFAVLKAELPVSAYATEESSIMIIDFPNITSPCARVCSNHRQLINNMIGILSSNNISLTRKIEHVTRRTTREKILSYLSERAAITGKNIFEIPYNRQELADYLAVDRSAMSNELCKMRDEGLIKFDKSHFEIV